MCPQSGGHHEPTPPPTDPRLVRPPVSLSTHGSTNGGRLPRAVARSSEAALLQTAAIGQAEVPEAPLEVFVQEGVQHRVEAAVGVAQSDAQMPAGHYQGVLVVNIHHCLDNDEDVDGGPADDEGRDDHQDHAGDPPHVPVFLFGAREEADTLEPQDH